MDSVKEFRLVERLQKALDDAGIPTDGCSADRIDFASNATPEQRTQGAAILAGLGKRPRRPKRNLRALVNAMAQADQLKLLRGLIFERLREVPGFAQRWGVDLDGDEPDV